MQQGKASCGCVWKPVLNTHLDFPKIDSGFQWRMLTVRPASSETGWALSHRGRHWGGGSQTPGLAIAPGKGAPHWGGDVPHWGSGPPQSTTLWSAWALQFKNHDEPECILESRQRRGCCFYSWTLGMPQGCPQIGDCGGREGLFKIGMATGGTQWHGSQLEKKNPLGSPGAMGQRSAVLQDPSKCYL